MRTPTAGARLNTFLDRLRGQLLGDTRSLAFEGSCAILRLSGAESEEQVVDELACCCRAAIDRSTRHLLDREKLNPAANRLEITIVLTDHEQAVRLQQDLDDMEIGRELSDTLTDYAANRQQYVVYGGRVTVSSVNVQEMPAGAESRVVARWRRERKRRRGSPAVRATVQERASVNRPADVAVVGSGRKTQHAGEGIFEAFTFWLKDGSQEPRRFEVGTPFYFGRNSQGSQIDVPFEDEELVSGDHFSILFLQNEGFVLRDNKSTNGTMVVRGGDAVRLHTPPARREAEYAKELRLRPGDVIRLEAGTRQQRRVVQLAFGPEEFALDQVSWADHLGERGIRWASARDVVLRRVRPDEAPGSLPEEYTLLIGDNFLGSALTGGLWTSFREDDENFRGGRALAAVHNFGRCTLRWLAADLSAALNGGRVPPDAAVMIANGSELFFGGEGEVPETRVRFQWREDDARSAA